MVISKILEATLSAGTTTVTFTDTDIPNSIITTSCSDPDLYPVERSLSGNTVTLTYETQSVDVYVALYIIKDGVEIIDSLESNSDTKALSAKQGKALKDLIDAIVIPTVPSDLEDLDDVVITEPADGQALLYNNGVWVNGDITPGGSNINYSTSEQEVGTWLDGSKIYRKSYNIGSNIPISMNSWTDVNEYIPDIGFSKFIRAWGMDTNGTYQGELLAGLSQTNHVLMQTPRNSNVSASVITLEYTKTS